MVITIIIAIVHQHATKDSQQLLISRLSILGERFNVFSYYLSSSCQVNCSPALICKTKRSGHKSTAKENEPETTGYKDMRETTWEGSRAEIIQMKQRRRLFNTRHVMTPTEGSRVHVLKQ